MYKVAYLDDEAEIVRQFQISTVEKLNVPDINLISSIEEIVPLLTEEHFDALIMDFSLNDTRRDIHFNGVDVINKVYEELEGFPCFILTSFEETAEEGSLNPDMIYSKDEVLKDSTRFVRKVEKKIANYKDKITDYQEKMNELIKISTERALTLEEEEELISLDNYLERVSSKLHSLPSSLKETRNAELLNELIEKTEKILKELSEYE